MTQCWHEASGAIELFFYGELSREDHEAVERHLDECEECRRTVEELRVIRAALGSRPDVSAPPGGDWSAFMGRLDAAIREASLADGTTGTTIAGRPRRSVLVALSAAAVLALVTVTVLIGIRQRTMPQSTAGNVFPTVGSQPDRTSSLDVPTAATVKDQGVALTELSEQHFERSKLVVLGLATKDPEDSAGVDWDYERELASSLLSDTRLYRQAAEEYGMKSLADVMRDLELVLLQTSMSNTPDAESLAQLQRLIRRRDLITKMDVVKTSGLLP
jgi:anti-sigma-K factor RskA